MILYVVIDTNVLVSSLISSHDDSATVLLVKKLFSDEIVPLYNIAILEEYNEVLKRKKFKFNQASVDILLNAIIERGLLIETTSINMEFIDETDKPFYETLISYSGGQAYLVTGNIKHFPKEETILTPNDLLKLFQ